MKLSRIDLIKPISGFLPISLLLVSNLALSNSDMNYDYSPNNNYNYIYNENNLNDPSPEIEVLRATSDALTGTFEIRAIADQNLNITEFRTYEEGKLKIQAPPDALAQGVVLLHRYGYDIIKLYSSDFSPEFQASSGNHIKMTYLTNGITDSYDDYYLKLIPEGNHWALYKDDPNDPVEFTTMFLKGRKIFGHMIGIENIEIK